MVKSEKVFLELSRRKYLYSAVSAVSLPFVDYSMFNNYSLGSNSISNKQSRKGDFVNVLSFQLSCKRPFCHNLVESIIREAMLKLDKIDLVTFSSLNFNLTRKSLEFLKKISQKYSFYISLGLFNFDSFSKKEKNFIYLLLSPYGELFNSNEGNCLRVNTRVGSIFFLHPEVHSDYRYWPSVLDADIIIYNDYSHSNNLISSLLKTTVNEKSFLIYSSHFSSLLKEGSTIFGRNNEIISQASSDLDQGIIGQLNFVNSRQVKQFDGEFV